MADRLHSAAIHLLRAVRREDVVSGVSPARLSALSVLVFGGDRTVGELAASEQVRSPTMSRLVAEMEAQGLVERRRSSADARAVVVRATAKGRRILQAARLRRVTRVTEQLKRLGRDDLTLLDRAAALIEEVATDMASVRNALAAPRTRSPRPPARSAPRPRRS